MLFAIKIYDKPNSGPLRDISRRAHLDYLRTFEAQTLFAGPFLTDDGSTELGSLRILNLPDRTAAERNVAEEPYIRSGAQEGSTIHRWSPSMPYTFRDCPRKSGNIQFMIQAMDKGNQEGLRENLTNSTAGIRGKSSGSLYHRACRRGGWEVGLMILDVPDLKGKDFGKRIPIVAGCMSGFMHPRRPHLDFLRVIGWHSTVFATVLAL